ncbi:MAG TPA: TetR/AcrR family transcriptional regulator [Solirubrobacteraceae bacterium]
MNVTSTGPMLLGSEGPCTPSDWLATGNRSSVSDAMTERQTVGTVPGGGAVAPARARRVDARRNLESILEAARNLLPEHPDASMQDIASEAGVHRATVHRHFAARDDLVSAVRMRAVDASLTAVESALSNTPSRGADAFQAVTEAVLVSGDTYRLFRFTTWRDQYTLARGREIANRIRPLVEAGQRDGDLRKDLGADELLVAWSGLITGVLPKIADGEMTSAEAAGFIRAVLSPGR